MTDFQVFVIIAKARREGGQEKKSRFSVIFFEKTLDFACADYFFSAYFANRHRRQSRVSQ